MTVWCVLYYATLGKVTHYQQVYSGKFERTFLLELAALDSVGSTLVPVSQWATSQARWWIRKILSRKSLPAPIPDPRAITCAAAVNLYSDAAGGGTRSFTKGFGGVVYSRPLTYTFHYWEDKVQSNAVTRGGHRVALKLTFLESAAALATLVCAPDLVRNRSVRIHVDNIGTGMYHDITFSVKVSVLIF